MGKTFETNRGAWKLGVAALGMALVAGGCADGDAGTGGGGPDVVASALITAPGEAGTATVRITGATDWQGQGRAPLALNVLIDGEPAGWVIGEPALIASEGSGLGFGIAAGTMTVDLATADGQVVWSFGAQTLAANRVSDLLYWGSADDPRVMRLDDPGAELPEGQGMARLINLDDRHEPVSALLC
ncbi:MAG: DUF4397 domain-containing protein, partial [Myxococcales bacterium]|nr:DUF4397 domain-containing protein [Myxococcales bacterium]